MPAGGDKGIEKSKFKNWNFSIPISDSDSLPKSMNVNCKMVFIFLNSDVIIAKIKENVKIFRQSNDDHLFANLDIFLDFSSDNI